MKNALALHVLTGCSIILASSNEPLQAGSLQDFGPLSTSNPNITSEIQRSTGATLEGFGTLRPNLTGLDMRTGVRFEDPAVLKRLVENLHVSGKGLAWDRYAGDSDNELRVYFENDKNRTSISDCILYFRRNRKVYCVPMISHWTSGRYNLQRIYPVSPASSQRFEVLVRSISKQAKKRHASFRLIDFGGD